MPIPLVIWGGALAVAAVGGGSYGAGRAFGEKVGKLSPYIVGSLLVYATMKAAK